MYVELIGIGTKYVTFKLTGKDQNFSKGGQK